MTTEERKLLEKWAPTGLLDNIRGKKKALLVARELDRHAQYALDHMSEHENWVDASLTPEEQNGQAWANQYFNEKIKEMRQRGCFGEVKGG